MKGYHVSIEADSYDTFLKIQYVDSGRFSKFLRLDGSPVEVELIISTLQKYLAGIKNV